MEQFLIMIFDQFAPRLPNIVYCSNVFSSSNKVFRVKNRLSEYITMELIDFSC